MNRDYILYKTGNEKLQKIVDFFFYVDIPSDMFVHIQEDIIPYPRATLGYFFNHPFLVNHSEGNTSSNMLMARISTQRVNVSSQSNQVKIIGVHLKPYAVASFTNMPVSQLPFVVELDKVFTNKLKKFTEEIEQLTELNQQFQLLEDLLFENIVEKDLEIVTKAVELIEQKNGKVKTSEIAEKLSVTTRTLRNHFYQNIGCSPKEYVQLVRFHKSVCDIKNKQDNLTTISYDNDYFDQAHFIKAIKNITGKTPKILQKEISTFRFLQF